MMKPTVGRIVHFYSSSSTPGLKMVGPFAALITFAYGRGANEGNADLTVFTPGNRAQTTPCNVPFSEEPKPDHWSWPPRV